MNVKFLRFSQETERFAQAGSRPRVIAAAVAMAVASRLSLPSSELVDPSTYFNLQISQFACSELSRFNEEIIMDLNYAVDKCRMFWMLRYQAAHPAKQIQYGEFSQIGFYDTLLGCNLYSDPETSCFMNEHKQAIFHLANIAIQLVECGDASYVVDAVDADAEVAPSVPVSGFMVTKVSDSVAAANAGVSY